MAHTVLWVTLTQFRVEHCWATFRCNAFQYWNQGLYALCLRMGGRLNDQLSVTFLSPSSVSNTNTMDACLKLEGIGNIHWSNCQVISVHHTPTSTVQWYCSVVKARHCHTLTTCLVQLQWVTPLRAILHKPLPRMCPPVGQPLLSKYDLFTTSCRDGWRRGKDEFTNANEG